MIPPIKDIEELLKKVTGPKWNYHSRLSGTENHKGFAIRGGGWFLAEVMPLDEDGVEGEANAKLISLAPTLARMLLAYRKQCGHLKQSLRYVPKDECNISLAEAYEEVDAEMQRIVESKS